MVKIMDHSQTFVWVVRRLFISRLETDSFVFFFSSRFIRTANISQMVRSNQSNTRDLKKTSQQKQTFFLFLSASVSGLLNIDSMV